MTRMILTAGIFVLALQGCQSPPPEGKKTDAFVKERLQRLALSQDETERQRIVGSDLWDINDPRIALALKARLSNDKTEEALLTAWYLAKRGDRDALSILNQNYYEYPVSSYVWSYVIRVFPAQNYRPAIPKIIESLNCACLNDVAEADAALRIFYPGSPRFSISSLQEERDYFKKRWSQEAEAGNGSMPGL